MTLTDCVGGTWRLVAKAGRWFAVRTTDGCALDTGLTWDRPLSDAADAARKVWGLF